jgi:S1-C subfamily serine protease
VAPVAGPVASKSASSVSGATIAIAVLLAFIVAVFAGLAGGFLGAHFVSGGTPTARSLQRVTIVPPKTSEPVVAAAAAGLPSVVNIDIRGKAASSKDGLPSNHPGVPLSGNGSGVAFKSAPNGGTYIITNNHVVEDADTLTVRDASGKSMPAKLVGRDAESDIAVVQVQQAVPTIALGSSRALQVGQTVVAIGSPFGLEHTVTSGVISALGRSLPDFAGSSGTAYPLVDVIQTDAAINPGNSGGALVDRAGKLVGINTAIYSDTGTSGGIGFAIPVDSAVRISNELITKGSVGHPFLGVVGQSLTPEFAKEKGLTVTEGTYIAEVTKGSGAEKARVKAGDVIVAVDGAPVRSMDDLLLQVRRKKIGDVVKLGIVRDGKEIQLDVTVGDKPVEFSKPSTTDTGSTEPTPNK